jgi:hypothetical protein
LVIPGGGLNSTDAGLKTHPFNPFDEFANEFRVIAADLRNAKGRPVDWAAGDRPSVGRLLWTHRRREMDSNLYGAFPVKWSFLVFAGSLFGGVSR